MQRVSGFLSVTGPDWMQPVQQVFPRGFGAKNKEGESKAALSMGRSGCHFSHGQNPVRSSSFRGLSLFRNHTETLAMQARLDALGKTKIWKGGGGGGRV